MCDPTDIIIRNYLNYLRKMCIIYMKETALVLINHDRSYYIFYDDTYCYPDNIIQSVSKSNTAYDNKSTYMYDNNKYGYYMINDYNITKFIRKIPKNYLTRN